jgi:uncharacterized membrane protein
MTDLEFRSGAINAGECITNGWELVKKNYGLYIGIILLTLVFIGCIPFVSVFIIGPTLGGVYYVFLRDMRDDPVDFGMMFKGFEKFVPLMVIGLIQSIPGVIFQILQFTFNIFSNLLAAPPRRGGDLYRSDAPDLTLLSGVLGIFIVVMLVFTVISLIWWAIFFFAIPLAMERDLKPMEAIKLSARASFSNIGGLILLIILQMLVGLLGMLLCLVGIFLVSIPVVYAANAFAYRQVFPLLDRPETYSTPPPPATYGSNFGQGF